MPAELDAIAMCERRATAIRAIQLKLGDSLLSLNRAIELEQGDSPFVAELRGRCEGLRFSLEQLRA